MSYRLKELLTKLLKDNNGRSEHIFNYFNPRTKKYGPIKRVVRSFHNTCIRAGIKDLQFRDLRRTYATRLHNKKVDPLVIQRLLRHSNFKISEQVYIQHDLEQMREAVEKVSESQDTAPDFQSFLAHSWHTSQNKKKKNAKFPICLMN